MKKIIESDWSKLSEPVRTILERLDLNREDETLEINEEIDIPYFKGIFTEDMANQIFAYQYSKENDGYYSIKREGNILYYKFIKGAFDN